MYYYKDMFQVDKKYNNLLLLIKFNIINNPISRMFISNL